MKKVLFLCIGNSIRSQMAEGFARKYGSDVLEAASAGFAPADIVQPLTKKVMAEKNISLDEHFPKDLAHVPPSDFDLIVNISGRKLPTRMTTEVQEWDIEDPMGTTEENYVSTRDRIEHLVMQLILSLRRSAHQTRTKPLVFRPTPVRSVRPQRVR